MRRLAGISLTVVAGAVSPALAHHSFAMFDQTRTEILSGVVTRFEFTNPHSWIFVNVMKPDGETTEWGFEMGSPQALSRSGWKRNTVQTGDTITVTFNPLRSGEHGGSFKSAQFADGKPIGRQSAGGPPDYASEPPAGSKP